MNLNLLLSINIYKIFSYKYKKKKYLSYIPLLIDDISTKIHNLCHVINKLNIFEL